MLLLFALCFAGYSRNQRLLGGCYLRRLFFWALHPVSARDAKTKEASQEKIAPFSGFFLTRSLKCTLSYCMHPRIASPQDAHSPGTLLGTQRNSHFPSLRTFVLRRTWTATLALSAFCSCISLLSAVGFSLSTPTADRI